MKPAAGPATAGPAKTPGRTAAKPKKEAPPKKDAPPAGKRMKDGYWAGGVKMFKPNGNGRCDARALTQRVWPVLGRGSESQSRQATWHGTCVLNEPQHA